MTEARHRALPRGRETAVAAGTGAGGAPIGIGLLAAAVVAVAMAIVTGLALVRLLGDSTPDG